MYEITVTDVDHLLSGRVVIAAATGDAAQLSLVLREMTAPGRPGGVLPVLMAMASTVITLAHALDGDEYLDSLRQAVLQLTQAIDAQGDQQSP